MDHARLLALSKKLNFRTNDNGFCYGYAAMLAQAVLVNELEAFNTHLIHTAIVEAALENNQSLESIPRDILHDVEAFLGGISIHFSQNAYPEYFEKGIYLNQDIHTSMALLQSKALEDAGGMVDVADFSGLYNISTISNELNQYFDSLRQAIETGDCQSNWSILLSASKHAIQIGYHAETQSWIVGDVNPRKNTEETKVYTIPLAETSTLSQLVLDGFTFPSSVESNYLAMSSHIVTTSMNLGSVLPIIDAWRSSEAFKAIHRLSQDKVAATDTTGLSWLSTCLQEGNNAQVEELLKQGAKLEECPDAFLAAPIMKDDVNLVALLLEYSPIYNRSVHGISFLRMAVSHGLDAIVQLMLNHGADVDEKDATTHLTLDQMAKNAGHMHIVDMLEQHRSKKKEENLNNLVADALENSDGQTLEHKMLALDNEMKRQVIAKLDQSPGGRALLNQRFESLRKHWKTDDEMESNSYFYTALLILSLSPPPQTQRYGQFFAAPPDSSVVRDAAVKMLRLVDGEDESFTPNEIATMKQGVLGKMLGNMIDDLPMTYPGIDPT